MTAQNGETQGPPEHVVAKEHMKRSLQVSTSELKENILLQRQL